MKNHAGVAEPGRSAQIKHVPTRNLKDQHALRVQRVAVIFRFTQVHNLTGFNSCVDDGLHALESEGKR